MEAARTATGAEASHSTRPQLFLAAANRKEAEMAEGTKALVSRSHRRIAVAAAALALALGGAAIAQPGPMGHHHGPGMGAGPDMLPQLIARAKEKLNLNTLQQTQFDAAVTQSKGAMQTGRANLQRVKDALAAELAKAEPNLAAVAAVADDVQAQNQALRRQVRDQWLALYNTFSPDQKAVVKEMIQNRVARAQKFRERIRERWLDHHGNG
jgi:periplasmic protein CpxP/Spy